MVLSLEPQDPSAAATAKELTDALRTQARSATGKYEYSGPDKDLVDEKLAGNCDTELPQCMAPIGGAVGASRLLYGHVRKVEGNFIVDLVLLNVDGKTREKSFSNQRIPVADAGDPFKAGTFAKNLYKAITNESSTGTLVVEVTNKGADRGGVKIDGDEKGFLSSGRLPIQNLSDGKHTLTVDVGGFQPFSKEVTVVANDRVVVEVTLTPDGSGGDGHEQYGTESQGGKTNYWKPMFIAGSIVAVAGGAFWAYSYNRELDAEGQINHFTGNPIPGQDGTEAGPGDCGKDVNDVFPAGGMNVYTEDEQAQSRGALTKACKYRGWTKAGIAATAIGGVIMLGTFYSAWLKEDKESNKQASKPGRVKKPTIAVTPIVTPNGGFATLRIDW